MTRMVDPLWEQILSRRALLVTLAGTPLALAAASRPMAHAQSSPAAASPAASSSGGATAGIVAAANAFLATLNPEQREAGLFPWTDTAQKQRWSNLPAGGFQRAGLMWGDLSAPQQTALLRVMQATLSADGYNRVLGEWRADDALAAQQANNPNPGPPPGATPRAGRPGGTPPGGGFPGGRLLYGTPYYYFALIGAPSETDPWQWQYGGHHVTINATVVGPHLSLTPSFIGVQPATYTDAQGQTVRPLGDIEDDAFALINLLDATQRQAAVLGNTPIDLVLGPGQDGKTIPAEGLPAAQMNADQRAAFRTLIGHYAGLGNDAAAAARMAELDAALDQTYLAWHGPTEAGGAAYFRVTGPTLVIEYAPQGGGGNGLGVGGAASPQHIHGIYRDPTNDYGAKYTGLRVG